MKQFPIPVKFSELKLLTKKQIFIWIVVLAFLGYSIFTVSRFGDVPLLTNAELNALNNDPATKPITPPPNATPVQLKTWSSLSSSEKQSIKLLSDNEQLLALNLTQSQIDFLIALPISQQQSILKSNNIDILMKINVKSFFNLSPEEQKAAMLLNVDQINKLLNFNSEQIKIILMLPLSQQQTLLALSESQITQVLLLQYTLLQELLSYNPSQINLILGLSPKKQFQLLNFSPSQRTSLLKLTPEQLNLQLSN
jgi:hypothetical protein